jgi:DNA-binding NarL/FixJ family response regulator
VPSRDFAAEPLGVLIVDDDRIFGESLRALLEADRRFDVLAVATTFRSALVEATSMPVDLALVDVRFGQGDGFAVVEGIRDLSPHIVSFMMSGLEPSDFHEQAFAAGAKGVIAKSDLARDGRELLLAMYLATAERTFRL